MPPVPLRPSALRRLAATTSVFLASGLSHEFLMAYVLRPYNWGIGNFFYVQVGCCSEDEGL